MFGKLLKHEMRATRRLMLPIFGLLLAFSVLFVVMLWLNPGPSGEGIQFGTLQGGFMADAGNMLIAIFTILITLGYVFMNIAAVTVIFFYAIVRFRSNLLGDEGYFMHTLPVTAGANLWAKVIASTLWLVLGGAAILLSSMVVGAGAGGLSFFQELGEVIRLGFNAATAQVFWLLAEVLLLLLAGTVNWFLTVYAAMSMGYSLQKHRGVVSICIYFAINFAEQIVMMQGVSVLSWLGLFPETPEALMLMLTGYLAVTSVGWHFLARYFLSRRLNLQ